MKTILSGALALTLLAGGALAQSTTYVPAAPGGGVQRDFQRGPGDGPVRDPGQLGGRYSPHDLSQTYGAQRAGDDRGRGFDEHRGYGYGHGYGYRHGRRFCSWRYHHRVCRWVR